MYDMKEIMQSMANDIDDTENGDVGRKQTDSDHEWSPPDASMRMLSKRDSCSTNDIYCRQSKSAPNTRKDLGIANSDHDVSRPGPLKSSLIPGSFGGSYRSIGKSVSFRNLYNDEQPRTTPNTSPLARDNPVKNESVSKRKCWKSHLVVSLGFCLVYTAFNSLQNLASSLLTDDGLGFASLSIVYTLGICSCFFTPFLVKKLTPKLSIMIAYGAMFLFTASVLYPRYYTLLPTSFLLGSVQGPLWTSALMYITTAGLDYAILTHGIHDHIISKFTGIFLCFQQSSQVIGNLLSSLVLQSGAVQLMGHSNTTFCGASHCPQTIVAEELSHLNSTNSFPYDEFISNSSTINNESRRLVEDSEVMDDRKLKLYMLGGLYLLFIVIAMVITGVLLERFKLSRAAAENYGSHLSIASVVSENSSSKDLLCASLTILAKPEMLTLLPISFAAGMQMAYMFADFTQNYITCALGMNWVGYAMTAFGATDMICSYGVGEITKWIGRPVIFVFTSLVQIAMYLAMLLWIPDTRHIAVFFVIPAVSGFCDAVWQPQLADQQEPAIASHRMFFTLGSAVVFAYGNFICMHLKIYLGLALTILGISSYGIAEFLYRRKLAQKEQKRAERKLMANGGGKVVL
ncbi:protein unc-93 homolog A-like isoform X2 [Tubulanus polymorphus]|uniref:protein unc-93 homolog A-like isoform X2 n=1 Tax=Tubulanus polymorphus TaxID=672921 RepID=UPI003DA53D51